MANLIQIYLCIRDLEACDHRAFLTCMERKFNVLLLLREDSSEKKATPVTKRAVATVKTGGQKTRNRVNWIYYHLQHQLHVSLIVATAANQES